MSDDIVARPDQEIDFVEYLRLWASPNANDQAVQDLHRAADEIERLRTLINHGLTDAYQCAGCDLCEQLKTMHLQAVKP